MQKKYYTGCSQRTFFTKEQRRFNFSPKERIDKRSSGFIIQWDRKLSLCLCNVNRDLLSTEESVEKHKPRKETTQHQLMAWFSWNTDTFNLFTKRQVSPGHIHDKFLLLLHLVVVNDWDKSSNNPLPQAESRVLPFEESKSMVISNCYPCMLLYKVCWHWFAEGTTGILQYLYAVHSLFLSFLTVFLLASAEVKQLVKLRLQEHILQPLHVAL